MTGRQRKHPIGGIAWAIAGATHLFSAILKADMAAKKQKRLWIRRKNIRNAVYDVILCEGIPDRCTCASLYACAEEFNSILPKSLRLKPGDGPLEIAIVPVKPKKVSKK